MMNDDALDLRERREEPITTWSKQEMLWHEVDRSYKAMGLVRRNAWDDRETKSASQYV